MANNQSPHLVANDVATELGNALSAAAGTGDPAQDLEAIAEAFRDWAHAAPGANALITVPVPDGWRPYPEQNVHMSAAIHTAAASLVGPADALDAARTFVAFAHGFVSLELAGTFRLGGDPATAYGFGITTLIDAMSGAQAAADATRRREEARARILR